MADPESQKLDSQKLLIKEESKKIKKKKKDLSDSFTSEDIDTTEDDK